MPKAVNPDLGPHRWWASARYVGGHSKFQEGWVGFLFVTTDAIGLGKSNLTGPQETLIPIETVASIEVTGRQVARSRVGAVLVFGLIGLGAKDSMYDTTIVVRTKDQETAYYTIAGQTPEDVQAVLTPLLKKIGVPFFDEAAASTASAVDDLADQLRELDALRDEGLLTDGEFEVQKARLLGRQAPPPLPRSPG